MPEFLNLIDGAMAPGLGSSGAGVVTVGASAYSSAYETACPEPTANAGDLLVAHLAYFVDETLVPAIPGWTLICRTGVVGDGRVQTALFYKVRGATAGGPHAPSNVGAGTYWLLAIQAFSGVSPASPVGAFATTTGVAATMTMPALTVTAAGSYVLLGTAQWYGAIDYPAPSGWSPATPTDQERLTWLQAANAGTIAALTLTTGAQNTLAGAWVVVQPPGG